MRTYTMGRNDREVLEIYKGVIIRRSNVFQFRLPPSKFKELIDIADKTGLSLPKIVALSGKPCDRCKGVNVVIYNEKDERIEIKRGVLSDYTMQSNGTNIVNK